MRKSLISPQCDFLYEKTLLPLFLRRGDKEALHFCETMVRGEVKIGLKLFSFFLCIFFLGSCKNPSYLHHKLQFEKIADDCSSVSQKFEMNSNINGERYEFNKCLPVNFTKENATFSRQGDTVVVHFENNRNQKQSTFHIILDIDTYPRYNFLTIDGDTFIIIPTSG